VRKWLTPYAIAAALILIVLLAMGLQPNRPEIRIGKPLPPGKVRPQLVNVWDTAVLLAPDGSLWAWGGTFLSNMSVFPQPALLQVPRRIGSDSDWTQVTAGGAWFTAALKNDGSLWAWGWNGDGAVGQPNLTNHYGVPTRIGTETDWTNICAGAYHNVALKNDGSLWAWGYNNFGQLGDGTTKNRSVPTRIGKERDWRTTAVAIFNSFALKSNGTMWGWGHGQSNNALAPRQIGSANWMAVSAYDRTLLALKTDGTLWRASLDAFDPDFTEIGRDRDWAEIYAGPGAFFARKKDRSGWACVQNRPRRGLGLSSPQPMPMPLSFKPWAFAPGSGTTLLLGKDGKLWTWGTRLGTAKANIDDIDQTPFLLWEFPRELPRSFGTGPDSSTNNPTTAHPADAPHQ
jgi:trimeric autotransporter adhesin